MALIRGNNCGNLASSKTANCPICGAPTGNVEPNVQPKATEPTATTNTTPNAEPKTESAPRTLNDILRERNTQTTLGDAYLEEKSDASTTKEDSVVVTPPVVSTKESAAAESDNGGNGNYDGYDDNIIDDYEAEITRHKRTSNGFMICAIILLVLLIPAAYFSVTLGMQKKTIEDNLEIVESARRIFEDKNSILQRNAEDLVTELESLKRPLLCSSSFRRRRPITMSSWRSIRKRWQCCAM